MQFNLFPSKMKDMANELEIDPKDALRDQQVAVVCFYAPGCKDCETTEPYENKLAEDFGGRVAFHRFDAIELYEIADAYGVKRYPTYIVFRKGKAIRGVLIEPVAEGELRNWLEIHLRSRHWDQLRTNKSWDL